MIGDSWQAVVECAAGALVAVLVWHLARPWLRESPLLLRENYAGRQVPVAGGLVIAVATVAVVAVAALARVALDPDSRTQLLLFDLPVVTLVLGFALLGFVDDLLGDAADRGFRGHVRALAGGRLTTGMLKLAGGTAVAVFALAAHASSGGWLLVDAAVVALGANLANLLDRAPGRLLKVSVIAGAPLAAFGFGSAEVAAAAPVLGASWAMLPPDVRERTMLGDTGANVVGATLGWLAVELSSRPTRVVLLVVVVLANVVSEFVSYSKVIRAVPPLRWLDDLGRTRAYAE